MKRVTPGPSTAQESGAQAAEGAACAMDALVLADPSGRLLATEFFVQFKPLRIHRTAVYLKKALGVRASSPQPPGSPLARAKSPEPPSAADAPELRSVWITLAVNGEQVGNMNMALGPDYRVSFLCPDSGQYVQEMTHTLLKQLNLRPGHNRLTYRCEFLELNRTMVAECDVFLWSPDQKVIVFDVDGTITKSDVVGYVETVYFGTFTHHHPGVCKFLTAMQARGLEVLYLTSRPIEAVGPTKTLLNSLREGTSQLPKGPLFMNTLSPMKALYQEVWAGGSGVFKAAVLRSICQLFSAAGTGSSSPFVAGFGNRLTDMHAYKTASVPDGLIFIIDTNSIVRVHRPDLPEAAQQQPSTAPALQDVLLVSTACQLNVVDDASPGLPEFESYEDNRLATWVIEMIDDPARREHFIANVPVSERMVRSPLMRSRSTSITTRITKAVLTRSRSQPVSDLPTATTITETIVVSTHSVDTTTTSGAS